MIRQCKLCSRYFSVDDPSSNQVCCSKLCEIRLADLIEAGKMQVTGLQVKRCPVCSNLFQATNSRKIYCSEECRIEATSRRKALKKQTESKRQAPCRYCGKLFVPLNRKYHYCSDACRIQAKKDKAKRYRMMQKQIHDTGSIHQETNHSKSNLHALPQSPGTSPTTPSSIKDVHKKVTSRLEDERIMREWRKSKQARKHWVKIPLEEAAAICKEYGLTYPQYQFMRTQGTLENYIHEQEKKRKSGEN